MADDRRHSFVYDGVEQVFAIVEVVVQHRGRQRRLLGNHRECCRGDALLREEFNRRRQQPVTRPQRRCCGRPSRRSALSPN
jgi:hypothetical protein